MDIVVGIIIVVLGALIICSPLFYWINSKNKKKIRALQEEISLLDKYKVIPDAETHAEKIKTEASLILKDSEVKAEDIIRTAERKAKELTDSANEQMRQAKEEASRLVQDARSKAGEVLIKADEEAKVIAGNALDARKNAKMYEDAASAMRNVIYGYGDEYIKPSHSLLDDLAEEYSFKEAGQELTKIRQKVRKMVTSGEAAVCDYAEKHRKDTAIRFVIDAFNGKVDSILSRCKHDNFGVLEKEIKDAFSIVNANGRAFRNAAITESYMNTRIEELHWAVRVFLLREEEKEEQRRIREAIREEEKAKREYEKAIKEAEQEEKLIQAAMEEARKHYETATEEEKTKLQMEIEELSRRLAEAEEKNARALSMAQQTRSGHVYVISNIGSFGENVFKIGLTRRLEPMDRVRELGDASVPFSFDVHAIIPSEDAPTLENALHQKFVANRLNKVNYRKEFFNVSLTDIKQEIESRGIEARWTMKAEALEYKESLALAKMN